MTEEFYPSLSIKDWHIFDRTRYNSKPGEMNPLHRRARVKWKEAEGYRKEFASITPARPHALRQPNSRNSAREYRFFGGVNDRLFLLHILMIDFYKSRPTLMSDLIYQLDGSPSSVSRLTKEGVEEGAIWKGAHAEDQREVIFCPSVTTIKCFEQSILNYFLIRQESGGTSVKFVLNAYRHFHHQRASTLPIEWGIHGMREVLETQEANERVNNFLSTPLPAHLKIVAN